MPEKKNEELNDEEMTKASGGGGKFSVSGQQTANRGALGGNPQDVRDAPEISDPDVSDRSGLGGSTRT